MKVIYQVDPASISSWSNFPKLTNWLILTKSVHHNLFYKFKELRGHLFFLRNSENENIRKKTISYFFLVFLRSIFFSNSQMVIMFWQNHSNNADGRPTTETSFPIPGIQTEFSSVLKKIFKNFLLKLSGFLVVYSPFSYLISKRILPK